MGNVLMSIDISIYRARIGLFHRMKFTTHKYMCPVRAGLMLMQGVLTLFCILILLLSGDVELNPGPQTRTSVSVWHSNVRSLNEQRVSALKADVCQYFDIIAITETFLTTRSTLDLSFTGYHPIFRRDRPGDRLGGGVAVLVSESLNSECQITNYRL